MAERSWEPTGGTTAPVREEYDSIPSTQARAIELAREGAPFGTRVVARSQTAGRGRGSHQWSSPPGGLYLSLLLRPPPEHPALLSLAAGAALARALEYHAPVELAVKWPNDIVLRDPPLRKLAGLLAELVELPSGPVVVLGVGLNVRAPDSPLPLELAGRVAFLDEPGRPAPELRELEQLSAAALESMSAELSTRKGRERWLAKCRERLYGQGRSVTLDGSAAGRIVGLESDGALLLEGGGGPAVVHAGEVVVEEP
jgi:BirA family transcriptional regulator, biotin operon repressor / biotin---[acetyl-CoA-carboxylase] ligase